MGLRIGTQLKTVLGIDGSELQDIESVLRAWQDPVVLGPKPQSRVEGNKLYMTRTKPTQCPALHVVNQVDVPLETVCNTIAFPMFQGVVEAVNPQAKHTSVKISSDECVDAIEIP